MNKQVSIEEALNRPDLMLDAMRAGARQAARDHLAHDVSMVVQENGRVVEISADEFLRRLDQVAESTNPEMTD